MMHEHELLSSLLESSARWAASNDLSETLDGIARLAREASGMERGCVVLDERDRLQTRGESVAEGKRGRGLPIARSLVRSVLRKCESVTASVAESGEVAASESMLDLDLRSVICVPLVGRGAVVGTLYVDSRRGAAPVTTRQMQVLELLAAQAAVILENATLRDRLREESRRLRSRLSRAFAFQSIVGESEAMQEVFRRLERLRDSATDILITGETGTGKERVAKVLHYTGPTREGPLVELNCAALPEALVDAELFGIERRVATGVEARPGMVEQAAGGCLFLDEVGDLPPRIQVKLLRFLQDRSYRRVGGHRERHGNVRVLAATNRDLEREIAAGRFREDLFYRLESVTLRLPPLRERADDGVLLAHHFLREIRADHPGIVARGISRRTEEAIRRHPWPGNVRELQQAVRAAAILGEHVLLEPEDLWRQPVTEEVREVQSLPAARLRLTRRLMETALVRSGGSVSQAALELGISRKTLYDKARRTGLEVRRRGRRGADG